jgi:peptide/nickel transport system ATP-binding protein
MQAYIHATGLVRIFRSDDVETFALQGLDLHVRHGEMIALIGPSGAGKSTLLNLLAGLDRPDAGVLTVGDLNLADANERTRASYRRNTVGFLWQQSTRNLVPGLTAHENVMLPALLAGHNYAVVHQRADELLDAVEMSAQRNRDPLRMSGGQQQRVALAAALACHPQLLLADEPTGEVDWATAEKILLLLQRLRQLYQLTIIMVTHDPRVADSADRTIAIRDGRTSSEIGTDDIETVVIDSAGRLQIPIEIRQRIGLGERATVTVVDGVIHITPKNTTQ